MNTLLIWAATVIATMLGIFVPQPQQNTPPQQPKSDTLRRTVFPAPELLPRDRNSRTKPMELDLFDARITVIGNIARTTLTMTFRNDNNAVLDGELNVPLDEGQAITRFAMEVNGIMREGVPVEKQQARVAFESTVRKNVDPGLVELTRGNSFRTRIYPIPANGTKTVIVGYDQELPSFNDRLQYVLPFVFGRPLKQFSVRAEVEGTAVPTAEGPATGERFGKGEQERGFALTFSRRNFTPDKPFSFSVPAAEGGAFTGAQNGAGYFYLFSTPEFAPKTKPLPRSITLIWDASGSGEKRQPDKEYDLLAAYFGKIGVCEVQTVLLRNTAEPGRRFMISTGESRELRDYLSRQLFDGATNLGALDLRQISSDEILMFSDGVGNFGSKELQLGSVPVYTINSAPDAEHSALKFIAQTTGGAYINLLSAETDEALEQLTTRPLMLLAVTGNVTVSDIIPSRTTPVTAGGIGVSGMLNGSGAELTLHYGYGGKEEFTEKITISQREHAVNAEFLGAIHTTRKIAELDMQYEKNKKEITRLGKDFTIVTRNTSLIVLDRAEDYVEHDINPPADLRNEYNLLKSQKTRDKINSDSAHFADVLRMLSERKAWYEKKFPLPERKLKSMEDGRVGRTEGIVASDAGSVSENEETANFEVGSYMARGMGSGANSQAIMVAATAAPHTSSDGSSAPEAQASIALEAWNPKTPYMERLKLSTKQDAYSTYLMLKKEHGGAAGFYLDAADYFSGAGDKELSLRVLSNIAEIALDNPQLLRIAAHRLLQIGMADLSAVLFRDVLEMRGEEPQSYRDLAIALAAAGKKQEAADLLYSVAMRSWDGRFPEIELIALGELHHLISRFGNQIATSGFDKRLLASMPVDVRVVLTWDTDNCDMDLWVTDPDGEKCYYQNRDTRLGGHLSQDLTGGYGPEEFLLKKAKPGEYAVQVNYYGSTSQQVAAPTTVQVALFTRYATGREEKKEITLRLSGVKEVLNVGNFTFSGN